jgi:hypothetical protein
LFEDFVKALTFVGSLSGLASVSFLVYDRLIRSRPSIFLIPKDYNTQLCINNVTNETIIIHGVTIRPPFLELVRANDLVTANEEKAVAVYGRTARELPKGIYMVIKPLGERTAPLHRLADFENADGAKVVKIRCRWRNTRQPVPWSRYVRIKTTVQDIRDLREAALTGKGA